ncbi:CgeB family protein [Martelella soudanensis]|uniref:hypothetical protein n=1 Tax=unclassified Martelella TaxID=2629616 RepID=UPI0015DFF16D|nr:MULTISPECIES: hypothetical protein [unclassified Martelella]
MKILFVALDYHDYTQKIIAEMQSLGGEVTYVDILPRSTFYKVFRTLTPARYASFLRRHHARALKQAAQQRFDRVVFLQAHQVDLPLLGELRASQPGVPFVLYNWDSLSTHDYRPQAAFFDHVFTFDGDDAEANGFRYLPLFGTRQMQALRRDRTRARNVYTVGNIVNPKRYHAIIAFQAYCRSEGIDFKAFMKITPVVYFRMLRTGILPRGVSFRSITSRQFHDMMEQSVAVFDFANHQQSGHTMRTIENLCSGKKIITNNASVLNEPFFSEDRFLIFQDFDFSRVSAFLDVPLANPDARFEEYGIEAFTRQLLLLDGREGAA